MALPCTSTSTMEKTVLVVRARSDMHSKDPLDSDQHDENAASQSRQTRTGRQGSRRTRQQEILTPSPARDGDDRIFNTQRRDRTSQLAANLRITENSRSEATPIIPSNSSDLSDRKQMARDPGLATPVHEEVSNRLSDNGRSQTDSVATNVEIFHPEPVNEAISIKLLRSATDSQRESEDERNNIIHSTTDASAGSDSLIFAIWGPGEDVGSSADPKQCSSSRNFTIDTRSNKCLGYTKKGLRCTLQISQADRTEARRVLEDLKTVKSAIPSEDLSSKLTRLACLVLCKRRHRKDPVGVIDAWHRKLFHTPEQVVPAGQQEPALPSGTYLTTLAQSKQRPSSPNQTTFEFNFIETVNIRVRNLIPYVLKDKSSRNIQDHIVNIARKSLTPKEQEKKGCIYIYSVQGNFGHLKIGVTTLNPEKRLEDWKKQCGHHPTLEYPQSADDRRPVPHIFRVEALVHAQLQCYRKQEIKCRKCHINHIEWFERSLPDAIDAVRRWSEWMRSKPYYEDAQEGSVWTLRDGHREDLRDFCKTTTKALLSPPPKGSPSPHRRRSGSSVSRRSLSPRFPLYDRQTRSRSHSRTRASTDETSPSPSFSEEFLREEKLI